MLAGVVDVAHRVPTTIPMRPSMRRVERPACSPVSTSASAGVFSPVSVLDAFRGKDVRFGLL